MSFTNLQTYTFSREWPRLLNDDCIVEGVWEEHHRSFGVYPTYTVRTENISDDLRQEHPLQLIWQRIMKDCENAEREQVAERVYSLLWKPIEPPQVEICQEALYQAVSLIHLRDRERNPIEAIEALNAQKPDNILGLEIGLTWNCADLCVRAFAASYQALMNFLAMLKNERGEGSEAFSAGHVFTVVGFHRSLCDAASTKWNNFVDEKLPAVHFWADVDRFSRFTELCTTLIDKFPLIGDNGNGRKRDPEIVTGRDDACMTFRGITMKQLLINIYSNDSPLCELKGISVRVSPHAKLESLPDSGDRSDAKYAAALRKQFDECCNKKGWLKKPKDPLVWEFRAAICKTLDRLVQVEQRSISYDLFVHVLDSIALLVAEIETRSELDGDFSMGAHRYLRDLHAMLSHAQYADAVIMQPLVSVPIIFDLPSRLSLFYAAFMHQLNAYFHSNEDPNDHRKCSWRAYLVAPVLCRSIKLINVFRTRKGEEPTKNLEIVTLPAYGYFNPKKTNILFALGHEAAHRVDGDIICREERNNFLLAAAVECVIDKMEEAFDKPLTFVDRAKLNFREPIAQRMHEDVLSVYAELREHGKEMVIEGERVDQIRELDSLGLVLPRIALTMRRLLGDENKLREYALLIYEADQKTGSPVLPSIARNADYVAPIQAMRIASAHMFTPVVKSTRNLTTGTELQSEDLFSRLLKTLCNCVVECLADLLLHHTLEPEIEPFLQSFITPDAAGGNKYKDLSYMPDIAERLQAAKFLWYSDKWADVCKHLPENLQDIVEKLNEYDRCPILPRRVGYMLRKYLSACEAVMTKVLDARPEAMELRKHLKSAYNAVRSGENIPEMIGEMHNIRGRYWNYCIGKDGLGEWLIHKREEGRWPGAIKPEHPYNQEGRG